MDLLNNTLRPNPINLSRFHNFESAIPIILIIAETTQRRSNTSMNIRIVPQQTLLTRMPKVRSMINASLFTRSASEDLWFPRVEVGIEVDYCDWAVRFIHASQER